MWGAVQEAIKKNIVSFKFRVHIFNRVRVILSWMEKNVGTGLDRKM
jgi:hypothetical protein